jgi:hypothetical protein
MATIKVCSQEVIMTKVLKELAFGLSRGFGIYFSRHNEFIETVMSPGRALKNFR